MNESEAINLLPSVLIIGRSSDGLLHSIPAQAAQAKRAGFAVLGVGESVVCATLDMMNAVPKIREAVWNALYAGLYMLFPGPNALCAG